MDINEIPNANGPSSEDLRKALFENDISTYYAVEAYGYMDGMSAARFLLEEKLIDEMDKLRILCDKAYEVDPDSARDYTRTLNGLQIARDLITQSNS